MANFKPVRISTAGLALPYADGQFITATVAFSDGTSEYGAGMYVDFEGQRRSVGGGSGGSVDLSNYYTKAQTNAADENTLNAAKDYADSLGGGGGEIVLFEGAAQYGLDFSRAEYVTDNMNDLPTYKVLEIIASGKVEGQRVRAVINVSVSAHPNANYGTSTYYASGGGTGIGEDNGGPDSVVYNLNDLSIMVIEYTWGLRLPNEDQYNKQGQWITETVIHKVTVR